MAACVATAPDELLRAAPTSHESEMDPLGVSEVTRALNETLWAVEREAFVLREQNYTTAVSMMSKRRDQVTKELSRAHVEHQYFATELKIKLVEERKRLLIAELRLQAAQDDAELAEAASSLAQLEAEDVREESRRLQASLCKTTEQHQSALRADRRDHQQVEASWRHELAAAHEQVGALRAEVSQLQQQLAAATQTVAQKPSLPSARPAKRTRTQEEPKVESDEDEGDADEDDEEYKVPKAASKTVAKPKRKRATHSTKHAGTVIGAVSSPTPAEGDASPVPSNGDSVEGDDNVQLPPANISPLKEATTKRQATTTSVAGFGYELGGRGQKATAPVSKIASVPSPHEQEARVRDFVAEGGEENRGARTGPRRSDDSAEDEELWNFRAPLKGVQQNAKPSTAVAAAIKPVAKKPVGATAVRNSMAHRAHASMLFNKAFAIPKLKK